MKHDLERIKAPVRAEMEQFEAKFRASMKTRVLLLDKIMNYIVRRKGKQMRPLFVFLSAGMCGTIGESTFRGAALIELLHTASLVHDDVVDSAGHRRKFFSINALWKNKIAVLVGDFLYARGLILSVEHNDFNLLRIVAEAVKEMSEGELLQMEKSRLLNLDEETYYEIIRQKTASLIASCCAAGACSANAAPEVVQTMKKIGERIGMAFQIKDDLFDYGEEKIGKPLGIDIREKKMTLPLIYALSQAAWLEKRSILSALNKAAKDSRQVKKVIAFVKEKGGVAYAERVMEKYIGEAMAMLDGFPPNAHRASLIELVHYTIRRAS